MYYWNVVKRESKTNKYIKIIKSFNCCKLRDINTYNKAKRYVKIKDFFHISNKTYYSIEFDLE